jgi:hypothetical protein
MHTIVFADGSFASSPCTHPEKRSDGSDYNISNARWSVLERCSFWAEYIRRAPAADYGRQERHYVLLRLVITGRVLFRSRDHRPCRMAVFPLPAWPPHAGGVADRAWHHRSHEMYGNGRANSASSLPTRSVGACRHDRPAGRDILPRRRSFRRTPATCHASFSNADLPVWRSSSRSLGCAGERSTQPWREVASNSRSLSGILANPSLLAQKPTSGVGTTVSPRRY